MTQRLSHSELLTGVSLLAIYLLAFLLVGSLSHRIRFIGTNARVRSGFTWLRNYYLLLLSFLVVGIVFFLVVQVLINVDQCMADSVQLYTEHNTLIAWKYVKWFGSLVVVSLCLQLCFVRRVGSRLDRSRTYFSFNLNWEGVCQVCMFHLGCRATHYICVILKQLLNDSTCRPVGIQANSISFDAQYASFWLLTQIRLPVGLSSSTPNQMGSYSLATYLVRACQGFLHSSELLYLVSSITFIFSQMIVVLYFDFGQGAHTCRQILYGLFLGIVGHGATSLNVDTLFQNTPHANMPATRTVRIRRLIAPMTNTTVAYLLSGAFAVRTLTYPFKNSKAHTYLVWKEVVVFEKLALDLGILILLIFSIVRKGARRQGYVRYDAVIPDVDGLEAGN